MTDEPTNLVLEQLRAIRGEIAQTNLKIGTLAESMVSMRRDINDQGKRIDDQSKRINGLTEAVHAMRADMRIIAIAVDEHTARLGRIEARLNLHDA